MVQNAPPIQGVKSQHLQVSLWLGPQVATSVVFRQFMSRPQTSNGSPSSAHLLTFDVASSNE